MSVLPRPLLMPLVKIALFTMGLTGLIALFFFPIWKIFLASPVFNGVIIIVAMAGILNLLVECLRVIREDRIFEKLASRKSRLVSLPASFLSMPFVQWSQSANTPLEGVLAQCTHRLQGRCRFASYLSGVLVFLGLLGTLWGLSQTVILIAQTISHMPTQGTQEDFLTLLKDQLSQPLSGMGVAFSSSLFGLTGSVIVNFFLLQLRNLQGYFYDQLQSWGQEILKTNAALPSYSGDKSLSLEQTNALLSNLVQHLDRFQALNEGQAKRCQDLTEAFLSFSTKIQQLSELMRAHHGVLNKWAQEQAGSRQAMEKVAQTLQDLAFSGDEAVKEYLNQISVACNFMAKISGLK